MCAVKPITCKGKNEICKNGICECKENFKRNDKKECFRKYMFKVKLLVSSNYIDIPLLSTLFECDLTDELKKNTYFR